MAYNKESTKKTIEEVIDDFPPAPRLIMKRIRSLILECLPRATEKLSYGVPFYSHHRMICFIWPPGYNPLMKKKGGKIETRVGLGFCQGNRMSNADGALLSEGRKQIYYMYFESLQEIIDAQIRALLFEAELVDESFKRKKKSWE